MTRTPNAARGETLVHIDGRDLIMCVNMTALAKIETALEAKSFAQFQSRLSQLGFNSSMTVMGILLEAGGNPVEREEMGRWPASAFSQMAQAIEAVFSAAMPAADEREGASSPPVISPSRGPNGSGPSADTQAAAD